MKINKILLFLIILYIGIFLIPVESYAAKKNVSKLDIKVDQENIPIYDGTPKEPTLIVKDGDKILTKGTHYTITCSNNINAGSHAKYKINGIGWKYTGSSSWSVFRINPRSLNTTDVKVELNTTSYTYDGKEKKPTVKSVKLGSKTLIAGTDYYIDEDKPYTSNVAIGTAKVHIKGKGNYTDIKDATFTIKGNLNNLMTDLRIEPTTLIYNNTILKPTVTVFYKTSSEGYYRTLASSLYTVNTGNQKNVGKGSIAINGDGKICTGTIIRDNAFEIVPLELKSSMIIFKELSITNPKMDYTGDELRPEIKVMYNGGTLSKNDYTVTYENNKEVGDAKVIITAKGKNCTNNPEEPAEKIFKIVYEISDKKVKDKEIQVTVAQKKLTYTGAELRPAVTVERKDKNNNWVEIDSSNFDFKYSNNKNAGKNAQIKITGKNHCSGTITINKAFEITKLDLAKAKIEYNSENYWNLGEQVKPTVTIKTTDDVTKQEVTLPTNAYKVSYENNKNRGTDTGKIIIKPSGSNTVCTASGKKIERKFSIVKLPISALTITLDKNEYEYKGKAIIPTVTLKYIKNKFTNSEMKNNLTITFESNDDVGTGKVKIAGKGNCSGNNVEIPFTIKGKIDKNTTKIELTQTTFTYTGKAIEPSITVEYGPNKRVLTKDVDYTVTYSNNTKAGDATIQIKGKGNYSGELSKSKAFKIEKLQITDSMVELSSTEAFYTGKDIKPTITVTTADGNTLKLDTDYTVTWPNNKKDAGLKGILIKGTGSCLGNVTKNFTIKPITINNGNTTITLNDGDAIYDYTGKDIQIKISKVRYNNKTDLASKDYEIISSVKQKNVGTYTLKIKGKENANYVGEVTKEYYVKYPLSKATFDVTSKNQLDYKGVKLEPAITQPSYKTSAKEVVVLDENQYEVNYEELKSKGQIKITIVAKPNSNSYGSKSITKNVNKLDLKNENAVNIEIEEANVYEGGTELRPEVTVKVKSNNKELSQGNSKMKDKTYDYEVKYTNNKNAGVNTAKIEIKGNGYCTGTITKNFSIAQLEITRGMVEADLDYDIKDYNASTGKSKYPIINVKMEDGMALKAETDYKITYKERSKFEGEYRIEGTKNCTGIVEGTFPIKYQMTRAIVKEESSKTAIQYTGVDVEPKVIVSHKHAKLNEETLTRDTDYTITYLYNKPGKVTVRVDGDGTNYIGYTTKDFTITKINLNKTKIELSTTEFLHTGSPIIPIEEIIVTYNGNKLKLGVDYELKSCSKNTDVGKNASITIQGIDYCTGTATLKFSIIGKEDIEKKIWDILLANGYNEIQAAGVLGNIEKESNFKTNNMANQYEYGYTGADACPLYYNGKYYTDKTYTDAINNGEYPLEQFKKDSVAYGLIQWQDPRRKEALYNVAKDAKKGIDDLDVQMTHLLNELARLNKNGAFMKATNAFDAGYWYGTSVYGEPEKPNQEYYNNLKTRGNLAVQFYNKYANK